MLIVLFNRFVQSVYFLYIRWVSGRACFKENSSLHISIAKAGLQFLNDIFTKKKSYLSSQISEWPFLSLHKQPLSLHILIHHCEFCASLHVKTSPGVRCAN